MNTTELKQMENELTKELRYVEYRAEGIGFNDLGVKEGNHISVYVVDIHSKNQCITNTLIEVMKEKGYKFVCVTYRKRILRALFEKEVQ